MHPLLKSVIIFAMPSDDGFGVLGMILKEAAHYAFTTCLVLVVAAAALPNPQKKNFKDQAEYDVITKVYAEADPTRKLALLNEWTEKYPETDYHVERARFYLDSYQKTSQTAQAVEAAKTLLTKVPDDFTAHYFITLLSPYLGKADEQTVNDGIDAATAVLKLVDQQFANRPDTIAQAAWDDAKQQAVASSHLTIGWGRMQQKDNTAAEKAFREVLSIDPSRGQVSYWLGQVVVAQQDAAKYDQAFISIARAALYDGPNSIPAEGRTQVLEFVQNLLKSNYGPEAYDLYWPKIEEMAKAGALPTARIELKTDEELQYEADQKSRQEPVGASFGVGKFLVGVDISPGTYRSTPAGSGCYWARLSGLGGTLEDVIANDLVSTGPTLVEIAASDYAFESSGCTDWKRVGRADSTVRYREPVGASFGAGRFLVGVDISPGAYRSTPADSGCYWARLSGLGGTLEDVIANDLVSAGPTLVEIAASDYAFESSGCTDWKRVGRADSTVRYRER
ncbi:MAG: tetratricopeptide repeat protein [Bryobacterales bacterium]|nr:tetratricopeptide repeat protein [Bryobacterales bacterium]